MLTEKSSTACSNGFMPPAGFVLMCTENPTVYDGMVAELGGAGKHTKCATTMHALMAIGRHGMSCEQTQPGGPCASASLSAVCTCPKACRHACDPTTGSSSLTIQCSEVGVDDGITHQLLLVVV